MKKKMQEYIEAQSELRTQIEKYQKEEAKRRIEKMREKLSIRTTEFWKFRAKCEGKGEPEEYDIITEDETRLHDPDEAKEHITHY